MRTAMSEGGAVEEIQTLFGLSVPVSFEEVKKSYRKKSKELHPDAGGNEEDFKRLASVFSELKQLYQAGSHLFNVVSGNVGEGIRMPRETVDGTPLSELGLGLGPTTNGRDCPDCEHRGYTITKEYVREECVSCDGSGVHPRHRGLICNVCDGSGKSRRPAITRVYVQKCWPCKGTGEIEVLNPVLPKGRLAHFSFK